MHFEMKPLSRARRLSGFTRVELVVILAMMVILGLLARPVLGHGESKSRVLACMANLKAISLGWTLFANDHNGVLPKNYHGAVAQSPTTSTIGWASGWLDWGTSTANTNGQYLVLDRYSSLGVYLNRDARTFHCPADTYVSGAQKARGWTSRIRSYSMDIAVGDGNAEQGPWQATWKHVKTMADFINPGPASTFVLLEEHPDSINDPAFFPPYATSWIDLPASFHDGAMNVTFGDGHLECRLWVSARTLVPVRYQFTSVVVPANDLDVVWMRSRSPRLQ